MSEKDFEVGVMAGATTIEPDFEEAASKPSEDDSIKRKVDIEFLLDIPLEISVEIGRINVVLQDLLKLGQGSVLQLNKMVGDSVDVLANRRPIAKAEVVEINDHYGIRITEIKTPEERIEKLK